jgi:hypothetical protein
MRKSALVIRLFPTASLTSNAVKKTSVSIPLHGRVMRALTNFSREQIEDFLDTQSMPTWVEAELEHVLLDNEALELSSEEIPNEHR